MLIFRCELKYFALFRILFLLLEISLEDHRTALRLNLLRHEIKTRQQQVQWEERRRGLDARVVSRNHAR